MNYQAADWKKQKIDVHWVDGLPGGLRKPVAVSATVDGKPLTAETTVKVIRPEIKLTTRIIQPWFHWLAPADPDQWIAKMAFEFSRANTFPGGKTQWVQLGQYSRTSTINGKPFPYVSPEAPGGGAGPAGIDGGYPYQEGPDGGTQDNPTQGLPEGMEKKEFSYDMRMWLMWKSPKEGQWVPISSVKWKWKATMKPTLPYGPDKAPVWIFAPEPTYDSKKLELDYPEWTQQMKP